MKFLFVAILVLVGCSSHKDKPNKEAPAKVSNESFKKVKPLKNTEVKDFYEGNAKALSPALQDETLDRYSAEELAQFAESSDPLMEISIRCSKGDFDKAFATAAKYFSKYQKIAAYWNQIANCHLNQKSFRKALLFYNKALEVTPDYVPALNNIGVMYSRQGQDQKALIAFERASKNSKFAKTPRYNLAKLYLTYGLSEAALPIFQGLLGSSPEDVDLLNAVGSCYYLMSDYQTAYSYFQRIPESEWRNPEVGINLAITLLKLNRRDDGRKIFAGLESPRSAELKRYHASVAKELGEKL